ncbi:MAG TPA: hypothetical protein VF456_28005 [Vicinamibacterales bacterium]
MTSIWRFAVITAILLAGPAARMAGAQEPQSDETTSSVLTDAEFSISFRKYTPPTNDFSPFYSWDAEMALNFSAVRHGSDAVDASALIQTVGTQNLGSRVSIGATGYNLGFEYIHKIRRAKLAAGYRHLSSHLTRDLTDKEDEVKQLGGNVPTVHDPSQFNIVYVSGTTTLTQVPFNPELLVAVAPIAFRFNDSPTGNVRRVFAATEWTLWRGRENSLAVATQHEWGSNSFNRYSLDFDVMRRNGRRGRLQTIFSIAPGHELHVSPYLGAVMDGASLAVRLNFYD